ncbi:MFS transporter [Pseudomonas sichuanensis]|uniref:MFS transporter n=1 Tax=Pseudomonas sichuanensis TaxID=2213015 RepID=UPI002B410086|nr:MFS transporter [Pseudomonas sichuanensis]
MRNIWKPFQSLYFAALMMLIGSGLLSTYLALRLAADHVDSLWIGALMAANYFGLAVGGKVGHRLIGRVGHIRAYATCAGIVCAAVLGHGLTSWLPAWIGLRMIVGLGMMCQYMVIESWLNEQADAKHRGAVFSGYMIASYLGLVLGQLILVVHPQLGPELLMLVAMCFALCLVPVAMTRRIHPAPLRPAPMEPKFFIKRVPQSLSTVLGSGLIVGSFYGLAPLYATSQGMSTEQIGLFMGSCILAGLVVQWPLGWLSDRYSNDHVESERRVSLTAMLLVTYGVGACIGPLAAGVLMKLLGPQMLYAFFVFFALVLVWRIRPKAVTGLHQVQDAPLGHVAMPAAGSPLSAALDPRVDEQTVQEVMQTPVAAEDTEADEKGVEPSVQPGAEVDKSVS